MFLLIMDSQRGFPWKRSQGSEHLSTSNCSLLEELRLLTQLVDRSEKRLWQWRIKETDEQCKDLEEELEDPNYVPGTELESSN